VRQFPAIYRLALLFSGFVFFILCCIFVTFGLLYQSMVERQIKADFNREMEDVLADHIIFQDHQVKFVKDEGATTLRQQLVTANMSAWFGDLTNQPIRTYGIFSVSPALKVDSYLDQLNQAKQSQIPQILTVSWQEIPVRLFIVPLMAEDGQMIGSMVLARTLDQLMEQYELMLWIFAALLAVSLVASFGLGIFLANQALRPLRKMAVIVKQIDLDNIHTKIVPSGHPADAIVELGQSMNAMLDRIHQSTDKQKSFVAHASHELKTPLTRAISSLELLPRLPAANQQIIQSVIGEMFGMSLLINQLLVLAKLTSSHQPLKSEVVDLEQVFKKFQHRFAKELTEKNLTLNLELPDQIKVHLPIEKAYLELIITNLFSNAIKYSFSNGQIKIQIVRLLNKLEINFIDSGVGMTPEDLAQATNAFYRSPQTTRVAQGYGIGLAMVKQICDVYGLKLTLTSVKNHGTTAKLILPILG